SRRDPRAFADFDVAEDFRPGPDHDAAADFRMAVLVLLAGAAERHVVQDRDVVVDHRRLADDEARGMVEENAAADARRRIDVALENARGAALQIKREVLAAFAMQPVRQAMRLDGVEALVVEHGFDEAVGGWIAIDRRDDIGAERLADRRLVLDGIAISLADEVAGNVGIAEALADAMHDGGFQRVVVQDIFVDEGCEFRLAACNFFRLAADARPDRIDLVEAFGRPRLVLSHRTSPGASRRQIPRVPFSTERPAPRGPAMRGRQGPMQVFRGAG